MKKVLQFTAASLLACSFSGNLHAAELAEDALSFTMQHQFNEANPSPSEIIVFPFNTNPLIILKQNFSKYLKLHALPVHIKTTLDWLVPNQKSVGYLPALSIITDINDKGMGKSDLVFPAYTLNMSPTELIDWKGLNAHFTFLEQFDNLTADINFMGLLIKDKYSNGEFGESTLKAQFNTAMIPTQMALHISQVTFAEKQNHFKLNNIDVKFNNAFSDKGMPIGNFSFKMGVFEFIENDLQLSFDRFLMNASGAVQDSLVKYTWHTQLNNLIVPTPDSFRDTLSVNFSADMILQRLDEGALLALHTTVLQNESVNIMVILGKFMEVLPKLLAQSPEIELSNVLLETSFGNVTASARISLDGKKVTSLEESVLRSAVQGNVAVKISQKLLKQMLLIQTFDMMLAQNDTDTLTETEMTQLKQQAETSVQQQIDMIVIMGFLEKTAEGDYQAVANFQENKLILNGKLIPLPGSNHGQTQIAPQKDSIEVK